jgi:hypothetical protein
LALDYNNDNVVLNEILNILRWFKEREKQKITAEINVELATEVRDIRDGK